MKAAFVCEDHRFAPVTHLYRGDDGRHILVTVSPGLAGSARRRFLPVRSHAFLCDADGTVIDADGDPANGMTPLIVCGEDCSHEQVLRQLGYDEVEDAE